VDGRGRPGFHARSRCIERLFASIERENPARPRAPSLRSLFSDRLLSIFVRDDTVFRSGVLGQSSPFTAWSIDSAVRVAAPPSRHRGCRFRCAFGIDSERNTLWEGLKPDWRSKVYRRLRNCKRLNRISRANYKVFDVQRERFIGLTGEASVPVQAPA